MSRYVVTGAAGFVGRRLSEYLSSHGHEVVALLRGPGICGAASPPHPLSREGRGEWDRVLYCELGSEPLPVGLMEGVDGVFHLANVAHTDLRGREAERYWQVNVAGTEALLQAAAVARAKRFVYFSSVMAVADPGDECVDERWDRMPEDAYGCSKREAEGMVLAAGAESGMHVCNLRPALVYGPGVKGNLSRMLQVVERGRFPPLPEFGNRRSMVSLDDLIAASWLAMERPQANGQTYIVADGVDYSPRALYEAMCAALGVPVPRWHLPEKVLRLGAAVGDGLEWLVRRKMPLNSAVLSRLSGSACYRAGRIRDELGWKPGKTFFDVLPEMVGEMRGAIDGQDGRIGRMNRMSCD